MVIKILFAILIFFVVSESIFSQTPPYRHYTSDDGLLSSSVYDIIQDKTGYIWIATNGGLSRFDGTKFKNFSIKEGLHSTTIVSVLEGDKGELYIGNYIKGINLYKDGVITSYSDEVTKSSHIGDIFLEKSKLYAHSFDGYFITYNNRNTEFISSLSFGKPKNGFPIQTYKIKKISDGSFLALTARGIYKLEDNVFRKLNIEGLNDNEIFNICEDGKGNLYAGGRGIIYIINNQKIIRTIKTDNSEDYIYTIMVDSRRNIWYSVLNSGFRVIYAGTDKIFDLSKKLKIQKAPVNKFMEDNEGNMWVSTFGKGLICLNNLYINNFNENDGLSNNQVRTFVKDNFGRIIIGTYNGINILENGNFEVLKFTSLITDYVCDLKLNGKRIYTCTSNNIGTTFKKNFSNLEFIFLQGTNLCKTSDSSYLLGAWGNNYYQNKELSKIYEKNDRVFGNEEINNRINKIYEDSKGNIWFGTSLGLCKMTNREKRTFADNEILSSGINSITEDNQKRIWFTGEKGIAIYDLKTDRVENIVSIGQYDFSSSTSVAFDKHNRVWIGNAKGLFILDSNTVSYFNRKTGLPSNEVSSLFYDEERDVMYIGTSNGFSVFDINYYNNYKSSPLKIKIEYIKSEDSVYTVYKDLIFEPENNNIYISFSAPDYSSPSTLKYQYKLEDEWIDTENDFLDFSSMKEGKYNIMVRAKSQNREWSEPAFLSFTIKPGFTETFIFKLLMFLIASGVIFLFALYRINMNKEKTTKQIELTKRINELKHQALSAMMNPHFIFNSLNSVQYLINKDRKIEANNYIAMMGKLIRKNLDIAGDSFISLKEEKDRLSLYLDIEMLRFEDKFSYEIKFDKELDIDSVLIPNMIIQPFVENAVWHGIMNSEGKGIVNVSFTFDNINIDSNVCKCLLIKVRDNGIGYIRSKENKKEGHISKGIKIIEERLKVLSQELEIPTPVIINDLSIRNENATGTEVIITLPNTLYRFIPKEKDKL